MRWMANEMEVVEPAATVMGGSCVALAARREAPERFEETALSTGLSHGAFYRADDRWLLPTLDWAHGDE